jgi:aldehyde dehydrogenase (NAD+)
MRDYLKFYIDGAWVDPVAPRTLDVINPATEGVAGRISLGGAADVDKAVKAARKAFETFSKTTREERIELMERIVEEYKKRYADMAEAITEEMGAPGWLSQRAQAAMGLIDTGSAKAVPAAVKAALALPTPMLVGPGGIPMGLAPPQAQDGSQEQAPGPQ